MELGICAWGQKARVMGLPDGRSLTTVDTVRQRDRRTDRQTDTGRQQRPRLRIASRSKKPETSVTTNTLYQTNYAEKEANA